MPCVLIKRVNYYMKEPRVYKYDASLEIRFSELDSFFFCTVDVKEGNRLQPLLWTPRPHLPLAAFIKLSSRPPTALDNL